MSRANQQVVMMGEGSRVEHRGYPSGVTHNFYIYGEITEYISDYVDMITVMDMAEKQDVVNLFINTPGGSLETTISIIHAMMRSNANIVCHADGQVASAGTLIFFAAKSFVVYPYAHAMFHDGSTIMGGKFSENLKAAQATSDLVKKVCMDLYTPYFTEDEVVAILGGGDYHCDSDELHKRVLAGVEIIQSETEETEGDDGIVE